MVYYPAVREIDELSYGCKIFGDPRHAPSMAVEYTGLPSADWPVWRGPLERTGQKLPG